MAGIKLLLHLLTNWNYGFFIDELYYIASSEHLTFGYVDHPPLVALTTWMTRAVLGDSLPALRFFPAVLGAATVFLAGVIAQEFGGGRFAQLFAGLSVIISPLLLYVNTIVSMNSLDVLIWTVAAWLVALIINHGNSGSRGESPKLSLPPIWLILGLWYFLISKNGKKYRLFGWLYLAVFLLVVTRNGKPYYMGAIYPLMLAGGAVALDQFLKRTTRAWPRSALATVFVLAGAVLAPMNLPVLPVTTFISYQELLLGGAPESSEEKEVGPLPQRYADMFGNEEMVEAVAEVFHELTSDEQSRCTLFGMAYPQAAAIDFFGPQYGLPKAISGHNSYWLWGPGERTGEVMIAAGLSEEILGEFYNEVTLARTVYHPYAMPWRNNLPIFLCRAPKKSMRDAWPRTKSFQ